MRVNMNVSKPLGVFCPLPPQVFMSLKGVYSGKLLLHSHICLLSLSCSQPAPGLTYDNRSSAFYWKELPVSKSCS